MSLLWDAYVIIHRYGRRLCPNVRMLVWVCVAATKCWSDNYCCWLLCPCTVLRWLCNGGIVFLVAEWFKVLASHWVDVSLDVFSSEVLLHRGAGDLET